LSETEVGWKPKERCSFLFSLILPLN